MHANLQGLGSADLFEKVRQMDIIARATPQVKQAGAAAAAASRSLCGHDRGRGQ